VSGLLDSLRIRQWPKNLLVLAGVAFSGQLFDRPQAIAAASAFGAFCLLSSAVYILNDVVDRSADRRHPLKRLRPIASGQLTVGRAVVVAAILLAGGMTWALQLDRKFATISALYFALMLSYTLVLKHAAVADVLVISSGFVLRAWAGAAVVHVRASPWLLTLTLLLALFLSLSKRRAELLHLARDARVHRRSLGDYEIAALNRLIGLIVTATLALYVAYAVNPHTIARFNTRAMLTVPFVVLGVTRYLYLMYRTAGGHDPSEHLLSDRPLLACVTLWAAVAVAAIYWF
jgi:4-hydroxybenzoate polyprenyltransferase